MHLDNPKPNRPALERLAAHIRTLPTRPPSSRLRPLAPSFTPLDPSTTYFDWANWSGDNHSDHSCGTYGCIAGHAAALFPDLLHLTPGGAPMPRNDPTHDAAPSSCLTVFGLTPNESIALTIGAALCDRKRRTTVPHLSKPLDEYTSEEAADRILAVLAAAEARHAALDTPPITSVPSTP